MNTNNQQQSSHETALASGYTIRDLASTDYPAVLALNSAFECFLSPMDETRLVQLHKRLGRALYTDLFRFATEARIPRVTCEFDIEPPNEASRRFHAEFGFREVGTQRVAYGRKQVSLQEASLSQ